jgi:GH15 family glucan-1,4-alpha-glucosidase
MSATVPDPHHLGSGYVPISDYGFLSDCRSSALVSKDGSIDWFCWPRFDSPSLFGRLLDRDHGGYFMIRPTAPYTVKRQYAHQTNVLQTTFSTDTGRIILEDWLHMGARQALCRLVSCLEGEVEIDVICDVRPNYAADGPVLWSERMNYLVCDLTDRYRLVLDGFAIAEDALIAVGDEQRIIRPRQITTLAAGESLGYSLGLNRPGPSDLDSSRERAIEFWNDWTRDLVLPETARKQVIRSALVLKGLQYQPSGAIVAAATTSLPETIGGERNYDYRFSWLRDAAWTLYALRAVGQDEEAQSWFDWLKEIGLRSGTAKLNIMYSVEGESNLEEHTLDHLDGYQSSKPVRVGNEACHQRQIDTYGELLDAIWLQRVKTGRKLSVHRAAVARALVERTLAEWRLPDAGIWEVRGQPQHFVYSKAMCWVALDRALQLAQTDPQLFENDPLDHWRTEREAIREEILDQGYDEAYGAFTQYYGSKSLDASNLQLADVGFVDGRDPRFVATVRKTQAELTRNGLVDRYRTDTTDDGFQGVEGTFVICTLWLALALIRIGALDEGDTLFRNVIGYANDLGLMAEQLSPDGQQLGNFPQAFTHIGIIACAYALQGGKRSKHRQSLNGPLRRERAND